MKPPDVGAFRTNAVLGRSGWLIAAVGCAVALAGCETIPERDAQLENARLAHDAARDNPAVRTLAPVEFRRADEEYLRAEAAWQHHERREYVDHLAYVAQRRAEIALETANLRSSEAAIANARAERDRVELEARTRDADAAQRQARIAEAQALAAARDAQLAEQQAIGSRAEALAAQQRAAESAALARALAVQLADLQARATNRGLVITLGDVIFETGSARLRGAGIRTVDRLATFMREHPERTVAVEGFTDNTGSDAVNQELSERRAYAIRTALIADGIAAERIDVRGYGKAFPIASNTDPTGRQMNRRVEVVISDQAGRVPPRGA
jgi:outer membrane protein OmpA-like peptidoglycan-associated protein